VAGTLMSRENLLHRVRTALGRNAGQPPAEAPALRLRIPECDAGSRAGLLRERVEALAGRTAYVESPAAACEYVANVTGERPVVASNAPFLRQCGITGLANVRSGISDRDELRALCAAADFGVTSADYALADTGTLVMIASSEEARLVSLLPPAHIAVVPSDRILTSLDELFSVLPLPADRTSSMVLITGPSRTADIEQILVRGVHGPGEIHVVVVE
jgi:L-lactate utilization protein LutC